MVSMRVDAAVGVVVGVGAVVATAPGVAADPQFDDPDANPHAYCFGANMDTWERDEVHDQMLWNDNNTDVVRKWDSVCNWSSGAMTDMHVMDTDLPGNLRGRTVCTARHENGECDRFDVEIDTGFIAQQVEPHLYAANVRKTICHEIGHAMSLDHYSKNADGSSPVYGQHDCMISGPVSDHPTWRTLGPHHIYDHVNWQF
jgi:hypothetical protein